ncbi:TIGR02302 family protein [Lutibaculum baratangense]|uniref:Methyl-accepting chemotaxis protein n=1 Tax=Lutibaculum baratangense AMV1 TaxID=631454 RepID=V4TKK2_9HYPH|nr:TIGR02302 family protein [Lutibaculum baratangense]ESR26373.1 Methyl-accepting chemotaxis protein [Lutibaculum baratangense AMV1]
MTTDPAHGPLDRRIGRAIGRARVAMMFERAWRDLLWPGVVVALFLIVSWFGLWLALPRWAGYVGLSLFPLALIVTLLPLRRLRWPGETEARHRVETRSKLAHRPLDALNDRPTGASSPDADRLWRAHQARMSAQLGRLSAGSPEPRRAELDPFALRAAVLLLLVVSFFWAGPDWRNRLVSAADPGAPVVTEPALAARLDAWISPPNYTRRPPIMLTGDAPGRARELAVPEGSVLTVRSSGQDLAVIRDGEPVDPGEADVASAGLKTSLDASAEFVVTMEGAEAARWPITVIPDEPPSVAFARDPGQAPSGALQLAYTMADDYGVVSGRAEIVPQDESFASENALVPAPDMPLVLPRSQGREGSAQTMRDLTSHPWAGAEVDLTLAATDAAGQEGRSETKEVTLPQRPFRDPLARAIVEQRRNLALDRTARRDVAYAIDALTLEPERHISDTRVYLGLRSAYWRLEDPRANDETLLSVVDQLWEVALRQEDGDLSLASEALRRAQERLAQALENDASDAEIEQLMNELRQALNEFMRELAMQAQNMPPMPMDPNAQMLSQQDLNRMLDQMEEMAKQGSREMAQQMLNQLQNMLNNLQAGRMMQSPQQQQMGEMMNQLGEMIQRQQRLMDDTFDAQRRGENQEGGQEGRMGELSEAQRALQEQLRQMMEQLGQMGQQGEGQEGQEGQQQGQGQPGQSLGEAGEAMGQAADELGQGQSGPALSQQGRALESLRRGAQSMQDQMQQGQGGPGMAGEPTGQGRGRADPLGRPLRTEGPDFGEGVEVPEEMDAARARQILEELRRRLSEPMRPMIERDYLERLLERF